jgi:hypothetical protein
MDADTEDESQKNKKKKKKRKSDSGQSEQTDWSEWFDLFFDGEELRKFWYIKIPFFLIGLGAFTHVAVSVMRIAESPPTWNEFFSQYLTTFEQFRAMTIIEPLRWFDVIISERQANLALLLLFCIGVFVRTAIHFRNRDGKTFALALIFNIVFGFFFLVGGLLLIWATSHQ